MPVFLPFGPAHFLRTSKMCTSVIVGEKATADGSFLLARSADSSALKAQHFVIHEAREWPEGSMYRTQDHKGATAFEWPQPAHSMRFTTVPNWQTQLHGAVGFNEAGVGLTGTGPRRRARDRPVQQGLRHHRGRHSRRSALPLHDRARSVRASGPHHRGGRLR